MTPPCGAARLRAAASVGACQKAAVQRGMSTWARRIKRSFQKMMTQLATDIASSSAAVACVTASP